MHCYLQERIVSDHGLLWLAFDLVETPQMQLLTVGSEKNSRIVASAFNALCMELARLRGEAEETVIRVGELAAISSKLTLFTGIDPSGVLESLSECDWDLWHLIYSRKGKTVSIEFPTGRVGISMPLFPAHASEGLERRIRFRVKSVTRDKAEICQITEESESAPACSVVNFPKKMRLLRPLGKGLRERKGWFLLYSAEFRNVAVDAIVRMALKLSDFSPSHLELISIRNSAELVAEIDEIRLAD
ncbi:hypothetical protein KJZ71_05445 [Patescibacteria group bacterium]|nr:hypothetical protein [Patescibacteria group bacterium]